MLKILQFFRLFFSGQYRLGQDTWESGKPARMNFIMGFDECKILLPWGTESENWGGRTGVSVTYPNIKTYEYDLDESELEAVAGPIESVSYPNPFRSKATISFTIPKESETKVEVYTMDGQLIDVLFNGKADAHREYKVDFNNTSGINSSVYIYHVVTDYAMQHGKLVPIGGR